MCNSDFQESSLSYEQQQVANARWQMCGHKESGALSSVTDRRAPAAVRENQYKTFRCNIIHMNATKCYRTPQQVYSCALMSGFGEWTTKNSPRVCSKLALTHPCLSSLLHFTRELKSIPTTPPNSKLQNFVLHI